MTACHELSYLPGYDKTGGKPGFLNTNAANLLVEIYEEEELLSNKYLNVVFSDGVQCTGRSGRINVPFTFPVNSACPVCVEAPKADLN